MSAAEALPWLFLVLSAGTFLVGAYLLVSGRQAKMAGAETNSVKFLGVEITSSTSGTMLILLSVVATVLIINLGLDDQDKASADIDPDPGPTTSSAPTDPPTTRTSDPTTGPEPSGLTRAEHVLPTSELDSFTTNLTSAGVTWTSALSETRPGLNCLRDYMKDFSGALKPLAFDKWRGNPPEQTAEAVTTVVRFDTEAHAEDAYGEIVDWIDNCQVGDAPQLEGSRDLENSQGGPAHDVNGRIYWRNFPFEGLPDCIPCTVTDSQAVGRVDDTVVIFSLIWVDPSMTFVADGGPIEDIMQRALAIAD